MNDEKAKKKTPIKCNFRHLAHQLLKVITFSFRLALKLLDFLDKGEPF